MADVLTPIRELGGLDPLTMAVRDFRTVETPASAPTDRDGFNEEAEHTARADAALLNEHDEDGNHDTLKIARAVLRVTYNPDTNLYDFANDSERDGVRHDVTSIGTCTRNSQGEIKISFATAFPSTQIRVGNLTEGIGGTSPRFRRAQLRSVTDASTIVVNLYAAASIGALAVQDEAFTIEVWNE